jgi:hypothetical protein
METKYKPDVHWMDFCKNFLRFIDYFQLRVIKPGTVNSTIFCNKSNDYSKKHIIVAALNVSIIVKRHSNNS